MQLPVIARLLALALVVAACSATGGSGGGGPSGPPDDTWRREELIDVRTGDAFTVDDLAGKLVVIEPMAIWCSTCAAQQAEAADALEALATDDLVYISLDVDPNERAADLAEYADRAGFDWRFAVASREVARSLAVTFGDQVLSPPSTPIIVVAPSGEVVDQGFGIKRSSELVQRFEAHLP